MIPNLSTPLQIAPHPHREADLAWWAELAPMLHWTWAKTYADTAPHMYVVKGKNISPDDYERLFKIIYEYGHPRQFYGRVNIELDMPQVVLPFGSYRQTPINTPAVTGFKFWPMTDQIEESIIINCAPIGAVYGNQSVPTTESNQDSIYDELAFVYDQRYDDEYCHHENMEMWKLIVGDRYVKDLLDVGAGTGLALDLKMVRQDPEAYTAVDPSRGMLNRLLFKHGWVRDVQPCTAEDYVSSLAGDRQYNTVISLFGSPSYIQPWAIRELADRATELAVFMHYEKGYFPDYHTEESLPAHADESREAAISLPGAKLFKLNHFVVTVVRK